MYLGILEDSCICVSIVVVYVVYILCRGSFLDVVLMLCCWTAVLLDCSVVGLDCCWTRLGVGYCRLAGVNWVPCDISKR